MLKRKGYMRIKADYEVWIMQKTVVLIVHVDDIFIFGTVDGKNKLKGDLEEVFVMKWLGSLDDTVFVGLRIRRIRELHIILISQKKYARAILARFGMEEANEVATPMDTKENWTITETDVVLGEEGKRTYQAVIGSLIYLMLGT